MRFVALALALAFGAGAWAHDVTPAKAGAQFQFTTHPRLNVIAPASDFTLRDSTGTPVRLSDLRGQVVLVAFIYTTCTTTCPLLGHQMATLQKRMKQDKRLRGRVTMLSVTVDPSRDSAPVLAGYASELGADPAGWKFLRDTNEATLPVLDAYHEWTKPLPNGELDHPARIHLIDAQGQIREIYSLAFFEPRQALIDIRSLAARRMSVQ